MRPLKILLLQPPSPPKMNVFRDNAGGYGTAVMSERQEYGHDEKLIVVPYMSLFYCASVLENAGYDINLLDAQAENLNLPAILEVIDKIQPSVIVSGINLPSIYGDLHLLEEIKIRNKDVTIIAIGTVCKSLHDLILSGRSVDIAVIGDPEVVVPELIRQINIEEEVGKTHGIVYRDNGRIFKTEPSLPLMDLDSLPYPAYHLIPMERYWFHHFGKGIRSFPIFSTKGCPYSCASYCPYPFGFGSRVLYRDPKKVVDEIEDLYKKFNIRGLYFRDQVFTIRPEHAEAICEEIVQRKIKIRWHCETRFDTVNLPLLKKMREAGCERINYGLESGDPEIFKTVAKPGRELSRFEQVLSMTEQAGITPHTHMIIGFPGETWETIKNSLKFLRRCKVETANFAILTPYPGTKVYDEVVEKGFLLTNDWSRFTGYDPVIRTEGLTSDELLKAQNYLESHFRKDWFFRKCKSKIRKILFS